jgi:hypothetical protein
MNARIASAHGATWRRRFVAIARQFEPAADPIRSAKGNGLRVRLQSSGVRHARSWK